MKYEEVIITQEKARDMLSHNKTNRNLRIAHVDELARSMQDGSFFSNGEPIIFNDNGDLVDGQHRLSAIAKCGITQKLLVVSGVPAEQARNYDSGITRTIPDQMLFLGYPPYRRDNSVIAAIRFILNMKHDQKHTEQGWGKYRVSINEIIAFNDAHDTAIAYTYHQTVGKEKNKKSVGIKQAPILASIIAAYEHGYAIGDLTRFIEVLNSGESTDSTELPIIRFRNWLQNNPTYGRIIMAEKYYRTQYALKQYQIKNPKGLSKPAANEYYPVRDL